MANPLPDADLQRIITQIVANQQFLDAVRGNPPAPPAPPNPPPPQIDNRWRIEDFGYFQPDLPVDERSPAGDMCTVGKDTYYRDVEAFCERIKDAIASRDPVQVRDNLHLCLRGSAQRWWVHEVKSLDKDSIRADPTPTLNQWTGRLKARFRPRLAQALRENEQTTFRMSDFRAGVSIRSYFQTKLLRAASCGFETDQGKLTQVYTGIDPIFRQHLYEPTETTDVDQYRELLEEKESLWMDLFSRNAPLRPNVRQQQQQRYASQLTPPQANRPTGRQQQYLAPAPTRQAVTMEPTNQTAKPCQLHLVRGQTFFHSTDSCRLLPEILGIARTTAAAVSPNTSRSNSPTVSFPPSPPVTGPASRAMAPYRATQQTPIVTHLNFAPADDTGAYQEPQYDDVDPYNHDYNAYVADEYHAESQYQEDLRSIDRSCDPGYDDATGYVLRTIVRHTCVVCSQEFTSRNTLFEHLREKKHYKKIGSPKTMETPQFDAAAAEVHIIRSTAIPVEGTGLAFRGYDYCKANIRATPTGSDYEICLDTGCSMTAIDRKFQKSVFPEAKVRRIAPVDIYGIGDGVKKSSEYVVLTIYLPGFKADKPALACITREFHIVEDLAARILIGNDIIQPEGIVIDPTFHFAKVKSCDDMLIPIKLSKSRAEILQHRIVRVAKTTVVPPHTRRLVPIGPTTPLPQGTDYRFSPKYTRGSAHLALHGVFPEAVIDNDTKVVAYYNNSDHDVTIRASTSIGEVMHWDYNERATPEDDKTAHCFFSVARLIPSLAFALHTGLTALQCASSVLKPGDSIHMSPDSLPTESTFDVADAATVHSSDAYTLTPTWPPDVLRADRCWLFTPVTPDPNAAPDPPTTATPGANTDAHVFTLLPPLDEGQGPPNRFGPQAVHVNDTDNISATQVKGLRHILSEFPALWEDRIGRIIEPEDHWLHIPLKDNAVIQSKGPYRVSKRDQEVIDDVFDRARTDGRLSVSDGTNPVGWPVFVVWNKGRGRPVVDLRGLNLNVLLDAYPLPVQEEIIEFLRDMEFISLFDLQKAFHQRMVAYKDRWKLAVVTHRGQEIWNVAPMGYCNSPGHMQRYMDKILEPHKEYAKCYIDDVVVFSKTYEDHLRHLRRVLNCLAAAGMTLSPEKCYVGFHSVQLLGRMVDRYGLSTVKEKTDAISKIPFPKTLRDLEHFMGLANYYRTFVGRYAGITDPLQNLKTRLLRGSPRKGRQRDTYTRTKLVKDPTPLEIASFEETKRILCSPNALTHHDPTLPLLYYVDSCKEWGYAVAIHQVPRKLMEENGLTVEDIVNGNYDRQLEHPVMYLSKQLNKHEQHYWSTELEIAGIVWAVQKTRHLVEGNNCVKLYTDHKSAEDILNSTTLKSTSTVRQNLRLIRASQFLSQHPNVRVVHRPGKDNINADALSRLARLCEPEEEDASEGVYGFVTTVVGMSVDLLDRLEKGYHEDPHFATIFKVLRDRLNLRQHEFRREIPAEEITIDDIYEKLDKLAPERITYGGFEARVCQGRILLYLKEHTNNHPRLCIPRECQQEFFKSAHDDVTHPGFERSYDRLRENYYMKKMATNFRAYVQSCPECQRNNPVRHKPHGELQSIDPPALPLEMITLDMVVKLPICVFKGIQYDSFMSITDKLTKVVTLIEGREDWSAQQWAEAFFDKYYPRYGVPQRMISDRGKVFLSEFWTSLFQRLRIQLSVTTAYHPQADGQSERTNQTAEIALRHLCCPRKDDWVFHLGEVEYWMNDLPNRSLGKTPFQYLYRLDPRTPLDWAALSNDRPDVAKWVANRAWY